MLWVDHDTIILLSIPFPTIPMLGKIAIVVYIVFYVGNKQVGTCLHIAAWDPHSQNNIKTLERIQRQAARFCTNNYSREPGSVTKLLQELGWETVQTRRKSKRITTLYRMEHNIIDIPLDQYIKHNTRCSRRYNSQFLQIRHSSNTFGHSFR